MIIIKTNHLLQAAKLAFLALYQGEKNVSDPSIFREDAAVIEVSSPTDTPFGLRDGRLSYSGDYLRYFPYLEGSTVTAEEEYFTTAFIEAGHLDAITSYLQSRPDGRRALVSIWSPKFLEASTKPSACITQLYFRVFNGRLEVHSHSRANDAYRLLLLDMQFCCWVQADVARQLRLSVGRYIHFVDSLQLYSKHQEAIRKQHDFINSSVEWSG